MDLSPEIYGALWRISVAAALGGLIGGFIGSMRAAVMGSLLMGVLGGLSLAAIVNVTGLDPFADNLLLDAGVGFSYAWAALGGAFLGYVVTKSSGEKSVRGSRWGKH